MANQVIDKNDTKRLVSISRSIQKIYTLAETINIEIISDLTDVKFKKNIPLNNSVRNLKQSVSSIKTHIAEYGQVKDRGDFDNDFALAIWRLIDHFAFLPTEQINNFMDGVDKMKTNNNK